MVLRLQSTIGNVVLLGGLLLFVVGGVGLTVGALTTGEAVPVAAIALILVGVGANVKRKAGSSHRGGD